MSVFAANAATTAHSIRCRVKYRDAGHFAGPNMAASPLSKLAHAEGANAEARNTHAAETRASR